MRYFETGATRDNDEDKLDYDGFLSASVLERYAEYMHSHRQQADGVVRASDNWQKGIPEAAYIKSLWRHFMDVWSYRRGYAIDVEYEVALCAMLFNVMGLLHERLKLTDYYREAEEPPVLWEDEMDASGNPSGVGPYVEPTNDLCLTEEEEKEKKKRRKGKEEEIRSIIGGD